MKGRGACEECYRHPAHPLSMDGLLTISLSSQTRTPRRLTPSGIRVSVTSTGGPGAAASWDLSLPTGSAGRGSRRGPYLSMTSSTTVPRALPSGTRTSENTGPTPVPGPRVTFEEVRLRGHDMISVTPKPQYAPLFAYVVWTKRKFMSGGRGDWT